MCRKKESEIRLKKKLEKSKDDLWYKSVQFVHTNLRTFWGIFLKQMGVRSGYAKPIQLITRIGHRSNRCFQQFSGQECVSYHPRSSYNVYQVDMEIKLRDGFAALVPV